MDSAWSHDDNEAVSINGFACKSFFFWTMHHFISLHASTVTNNLLRQKEHSSNFFHGPFWERAQKAVRKQRCNCRLLAKSYFQVKGNFCLPEGAEYHVYVVVLFWWGNSAWLHKTVATVHGVCVQELVPFFYWSAARRVAVCSGLFCILFHEFLADNICRNFKTNSVFTGWVWLLLNKSSVLFFLFLFFVNVKNIQEELVHAISYLCTMKSSQYQLLLLSMHFCANVCGRLLLLTSRVISCFCHYQEESDYYRHTKIPPIKPWTVVSKKFPKCQKHNFYRSPNKTKPFPGNTLQKLCKKKKKHFHLVMFHSFNKLSHWCFDYNLATDNPVLIFTTGTWMLYPPGRHALVATANLQLEFFRKTKTQRQGNEEHSYFRPIFLQIVPLYKCVTT